MMLNLVAGTLDLGLAGYMILNGVRIVRGPFSTRTMLVILTIVGAFNVALWARHL